MLRMIDLRVVLDAVEAAALIADGHIGAGVGVGHQSEALRHLLHVVPVTHPGDALGGKALEELAGRIEIRLGLAVLPGGVVLGLGNPAAQVMGIHAVGATGKDDADGIHGADVRQRGGVGLYLAVDAALPDPAGNELIVLSAEVQHDDSLVRQGNSSFV